MKTVFVYGTLKTGYGNNSLLADATLVGKATTIDNFLLTDVGFPYMVRYEQLVDNNQQLAKPVEGEVWSVDQDTLASLDRLEGVKYGHYQHTEVDVTMEDGSVFTTTAYTPCDSNEQFHRICETVTKNDNTFYRWG